MSTKQTLALIIFDRDKLTYLHTVSGATGVFPFTPDVVRDFDVVDAEKLMVQLTSFIDTNKLVPSTLVFLMADHVLFVKDILPVAPVAPIPDLDTTSNAPKIPENILSRQEEEKTIKKYLGSVPFEKLAYNTYPLTTGKRVIATNAVLTGIVKDVFEKKGFSLSFTAPASLLGKDVLLSGITMALAAQVTAKFDWLKSQALDVDEEVIPRVVAPTPMLTIGGKTDYKRLALFGGVFVILLIIMIVMYLNSQTPVPVKPVATVPITQFATPTPMTEVSPSASISAPTIVPPISTQSAALLAKTEKVQITASNANLPKAQQVKSYLLQAGFVTVDVLPQQGAIGGSSSILTVSTTVPQPVRDLLLQSVKVSLPTATMQETGAGKYQITITIQG